MYKRQFWGCGGGRSARGMCGRSRAAVRAKSSTASRRRRRERGGPAVGCLLYTSYFGKLNLPVHTIFQEKYGAGEPTDVMVCLLYTSGQMLGKFPGGMVANYLSAAAFGAKCGAVVSVGEDIDCCLCTVRKTCADCNFRTVSE